MNAFVTRIPDEPTSEGMRNALRRARQLADLRWTPIRPFPAIVSEGPASNGSSPIFLPAWAPQVGVNYSAARYDEKYVGFNVSLDTYMTAMANPDSVLYTRNLHGRHRLCAAWYGTVCSQFASYVMDLPFHIDCHQWPHLDSVEVLDLTAPEQLRLCDILNHRTRHTAAITGITRDAAGRVLDITVTESARPGILRRTFLPTEFTNYWLMNGYEVLRYHKLHTVTYTPSPWVHLEGDPQTEAPVPNPTLLPDYGDKANYLLGESVCLSVFDPSCHTVEVCCARETLTLPVEDDRVVFTPAAPGFYRAAAIGEHGPSQPVDFCVVEASATTQKDSYAQGEPICPAFSSAAPEDELRGWVVKTDAYAKYWCYPISDAGVIPAQTTLPAGRYMILGLYANSFGLYSTPPCHITVTQPPCVRSDPAL